MKWFNMLDRDSIWWSTLSTYFYNEKARKLNNKEKFDKIIYMLSQLQCIVC